MIIYVIGVFVFVDYKDDFKNCTLFLTEALTSVGVKIEETFNDKVISINVIKLLIVKTIFILSHYML